ncbi:unnamed protein product [Adineta steineri]|uniref:Uncharacterized protein n=2 Tax=Adineta steineri TaxID=433720 RepID=A0A814T287_9BILA|nr:unnamed protein product [Adineta steineri]CAF3585709.1 unnamed protein product [Adineta steineri]
MSTWTSSVLNAPCLSMNDNTDVTLYIILLSNDITMENILESSISSYISEDAKQFFTVNALNLVKAIKGVFRFVSGKGNDTCFRVTATCVATNYHVTQLILTPRPYDIPMFIDEMNVDSSFNIIKSYFTSVDSEQNEYPTVEKQI